MSDELEKSAGEHGETENAEGAERPTVSPPFDPAAFARDVLSTPSPARGTPAVAGPTGASADAHTHATPPQGMAAQAAVLELARGSTPPEPTGDDKKAVAVAVAPPPPSHSIGSLAAQKLPSHDLPRIDVGPKRTESAASTEIDQEWVELATRPPPADAPDEDPILEVSHETGAGVSLDLDEVDHLEEKPTAPRAKLPSLLDEPPPPTAPAPPTEELGVERATSKKPPGEREMNDRIEVGDYSGALEIAEAILVEKPEDTAATVCADNCRKVLRKMYAARIGPLDRVPSVAVARDQLRWLSIDHKAGFVLSLVDGVSSLEMIIDVNDIPELDTLRILSELAQQRIISLR